MSKKRRRSISFNTVISTAGVALGVMALLVVLSVMSGFQEDLQKKILGVNAHVVVMSYSGKIQKYLDVMKKAEEIKGVKAASPFLMGQVMLSRNQRSQGVFIRGILPKYEKRTTEIYKHMYMGNFDDLAKNSSTPGIIIGRELASSLGVLPGDTVNVISPIGEMGPLGMLPRAKKFRVVGIFEVGMYDYDANLAIVSLNSLQEFLHFPGQVNAIELRLDDIYSAPVIKKSVIGILGPTFYARDWIEMNRNLFAALKLEKFTMFIILTLIILVAAFNIVSTLIMNVIEKEREIAILKTMGATDRGIMSIFMIQGLLIGIIGTLIGLTGGFLISFLINNFEIIKLPADVYYLSHLPAKMELSDFIIVCTSAVFISFLATIYPARQASKLAPAEALRYE
ncbi:MAG TPA: lipoprotein-releasing ABC transporter permease subunit [Nitrospirae bacterium]|nr:lipoprotein-releasing ABC transporter permease subunit [Nitrospirota bacterium]HDO22299.1 lipoprotein-releasing ABC transporter permease subunit [Nitrospirota bacterium]HDZ88718.1 lipoprotein-releasing ABC transporter permease subunit [Nitrospirota bacterium]